MAEGIVHATTLVSTRLVLLLVNVEQYCRVDTDCRERTNTVK